MLIMNGTDLGVTPRYNPKFEELKKELFNWGRDYIEEFLGYEYDYDLSKDEIDCLMDEVYEQMPAETIEEFYEKFLIK